ncbi:hypothetical protein Poly41_19880 [Novipirellula artificiosorum]|uniref:Uncharacterized protein n=1 Tax=Novipirellula artificiosorum TaxID=2528016 RepID=A0A5C6DWN5_9BACT|nr:hypothetical protein Poly41_19880 [Novipirellula artificiosorum]
MESITDSKVVLWSKSIGCQETLSLAALDLSQRARYTPPAARVVKPLSRLMKKIYKIHLSHWERSSLSEGEGKRTAMTA